MRTTNRYLDLLVDLLLVRRLPPWHANVGKRLVKSPKVYVRDSGLVHALLGGWALLLLMALAAPGARVEHRFYASIALCVGAVQTVLATAWLQRQSGLRIRLAAAHGPVPAHWLSAHRIASVEHRYPATREDRIPF